MQGPDSWRAEDHDELAGQFLAVVAEAAKLDRSTLEPLWSGFRRALLLHLEAEELLLIPAYAAEHREEAGALLRDHAFFRAALDDFEASLDARLRHEHLVQAFVERLNAHARSENAGLYAWARGRRTAPAT
jgi:hypothetical protein